MTRGDRTRAAYCRGERLTLDDGEYARWVRTFSLGLMEADLGRAGDLTTQVLGLRGPARARVVGKAAGVAAGLAEAAWFYRQAGLRVELQAVDGARIEPGDGLLELMGDLPALLAAERTGLNLLQRMSGIATRTRASLDRLAAAGLPTLVVGTRKTPWGPLDHRSIHLGGGGTHRLGLWDAILIKDNHLAALGGFGQAVIDRAIRLAWPRAGGLPFVEVEITNPEQAVAAARAFAELRRAPERDPEGILMTDNLAPARLAEIVSALQAAGLRDAVLIEASGGVSEESLLDFAKAGADAASMGALTHSATVLDIHEKLR
jgi:nicotinate-nucleotide pyrophosphorylase (carboxylating)